MTSFLLTSFLPSCRNSSKNRLFWGSRKHMDLHRNSLCHSSSLCCSSFHRSSSHFFCSWSAQTCRGRPFSGSTDDNRARQPWGCGNIHHKTCRTPSFRLSSSSPPFSLLLLGNNNSVQCSKGRPFWGSMARQSWGSSGGNTRCGTCCSTCRIPSFHFSFSSHPSSLPWLGNSDGSRGPHSWGNNDNRGRRSWGRNGSSNHGTRNIHREMRTS
mmetsp:Transcript_25002/g.47461  ORF Transcript_25002/g.47461 Transcript_25002/m.47461 type:complete len:212 (-) Transcript_25002:289-924(-)